jgi:putative ABC transport system permease protein
MRHLNLLRDIELGIKNLLMNKLRSLLTVLGIVFGVGSVIAMLSVGEGASREAIEQIRKLGSHNIILTSVKPIEEEMGSVRRVHMSIYGLRYEDELRIIETLPGVRVTVPAKLIRKKGILGERALEMRIVGTTPDWFNLVKRRVIAGRVLSQVDFDNHAGVCVLTEFGARRLLATEHTIGQFIRIGGEYYEVIGIVRSEQGGEDAQTPDENADVYIPLNVARERYGDIIVRRSAGSRERERVELHQLLVQVGRIEQVEPTATAITVMLKRFHKKNDYRIEVPLGLLKQAEATRRRFNIVLGSIAGISLLVGGIGIMNIMLASVMERTREIGIRRAIGAKRKQIIGQFLVETVVLSSVGGVIGIGIGILLPWFITYFSGMPTIIPLYGIVLALGISVGVGVLFGIYPAVRAARLDPIEALRHE